MMLGLLLAAVCVAFFFSGLEAGLTSVNRLRLRQRAREGQEAAQRLDALLEHPGRLLATVLIITVSARILALAFLYASLEGRVGEWGALAILLVSLPLLTVVLDFLPKVLFRRFPYRKLLLFATLLQAVAWLLAPFTWLASRFAAPRFERLSNLSRRPVAGVAELRSATNEAMAAGALNPLQKHYLHSLLSARTSTLAEVAQSVSAWPQISPEEKIFRLLDKAHQAKEAKQGPHHKALRFLVTQKMPGDSARVEVLGIIRVFDLLVDGISSGTAQSYMRRLPELAGELTPLEGLLALRAQRADTALVITGSGEEPLLVTSRDLIRRLLHGASSTQPRSSPAAE